MENRFSKTQTVVTVAMLIALEIILTRFVSISTPIIRIGFGWLPIAIAGILFGPLWAGAAYAIGDVIGASLFPTTGGFFPGFTVSAFLTGVIYGLFLHKHQVTWKRTAIATALVTICVNLLLNTFWISIMVGKGYLALLPPRIVKEIIAIPVYTILIMAINKAMLRFIKY